MKTTTATRDTAVAAITSNASPAAYVAAVLSALHGDHIVIDPGSRSVWWAFENQPSGDGWTVEQLAPALAAEQAAHAVGLILDRVPDPAADMLQDQAALNEYAAILRLSVPADPADAAQHIERRRRWIAHQDAIWERVYAELAGEG